MNPTTTRRTNMRPELINMMVEHIRQRREEGEQMLALEAMALQLADELKAARRVVETARPYYDWMFGGSVTVDNKHELIHAVDAYDEVLGRE